MWDLQKLFIRHAREIDRFLRRRGHTPQTAADLTQDTFVRVLSAVPQGTDDNPRAYLHRVARNLSVDWQRRERVVAYVDPDASDLQQFIDPAPSAFAVVYDRQRLAIVEKAMRELPDKTRQAFELHRLGDKTLKEVGAELGLSTSRTWALIRQAYLHLRTRLNEDGV